MYSELYNRALRVIPGGVNSPVRSFLSTGLHPLFVRRSDGKYLYDENDRQFLDFCMSWGAIILGHNSPVVRSAIQAALDDGTSYGFCHKHEAELAELVIESFPSIHKIRFVNSGTEAVISAARLARAFTGRNLIVKFDGCYHGHGDPFLVRAGSGVGEISQASSKGVPSGTVADTVSLAYNDIDAASELFAKRGEEIACVIVEPVAGNMGCVPPEPGYLAALRRLTTGSGAILIFDEVISGFRVSLGGAQGVEKIVPDLTTLGKIIGGGLPVGAFGGRSDIMDQLAPLGGVYQAGTLSGNPLAMRAGIAVLTELRKRPEIYVRMEELVTKCVKALDGIEVLSTRCYKTIFGIFHTSMTVRNFDNAKSQDTDRFKKRFSALFERGVLAPPSPYETFFLSALHDEEDIRRLAEILSG